MARPPLLQLAEIGLGFGGDPVLADLSLVLQAGDRLALVGRNGSGKSTLLKVMAGLVEPDRGQRTLAPGVTVGYLEQDPDFSGFSTLGAFAAAGLPEGEGYRLDRLAEGLRFDPALPAATASGGERRRAALARVLAAEPELLLLDEPTNHLDVATIEWLEAELQASRSAFVLISHDRAFVRALTRATLWLDRGEVRRRDGAFDGFEDWRDEVWAAEDAARHKLDRKIKAEARWAVEGISARRKRNMGRVRALAALRADRAAQIRRQGTAAMSFESAGPSGARVIEVEALSKRFGATEIARNLSFRVMRGDRVAIVGPNGAGKTTLLRTILGDEAPDQGRITLGTGLEIAVYDQARAALDPDATLWETLTKDPALGVSGNGDQVMVRGQPRHVVGYLKDFLFDDAQARAPVRSLSGGERARLLLARLMAQPANLLVLDEPTNDLDVETLDLLQDILAEFAGTVVFVSHDRDFIDRVATLTIAMEGGGTVRAYPGGWSDYVAQRGPRAAPPTVRTAAMQAPRTAAAPPPPAPGTKGLTFTEKKRFADLPDRIATLERDIAKLSDLLADPDLFARDPARFDKASRAMTERQEALRLAEDDWLSLAEKAEAGS